MVPMGATGAQEELRVKVTERMAAAATVVMEAAATAEVMAATAHYAPWSSAAYRQCAPSLFRESDACVLWPPARTQTHQAQDFRRLAPSLPRHKLCGRACCANTRARLSPLSALRLRAATECVSRMRGAEHKTCKRSCRSRSVARRQRRATAHGPNDT